MQPCFRGETVPVAGKPIEIPMSGNVDQSIDCIRADDEVLVSEEGGQRVKTSGQHERRYKIPLLPVMEVEEAKVGDLTHPHDDILKRRREMD